MIRKLIFIILRLSMVPLVFREFIQRRRVTIVLYHDIKPDIADRDFRVLTRKYNVIRLQDYLDARKKGSLDQLPPKSLVITFDDGHKGNHRLKSIFQRYHICPTVFLCTGIIDTTRYFWFLVPDTIGKRQYLKTLADRQRLEILADLGFEEQKEYGYPQALSKQEIEDLEGLVDFQAHTVFHPILPRCASDKAYDEISESRQHLEQVYGIHVYAFAYPNGDYTDREVEFVKEAGYDCALTLDAGFNDEKTDPFRLKRMCMRDNGDISELLVKASGVWDLCKQLLRKWRNIG